MPGKALEWAQVLCHREGAAQCQRHQALLRTMTEDTEVREFPGAELTLLPVSSDTFQPGSSSQDPSHPNPRTERPPTGSVGSPNPVPGCVQHLHPRAIPALHLSQVSHLPSIPPPPFEPKVNLCWGNDTARGTGKL